MEEIEATNEPAPVEIHKEETHAVRKQMLHKLLKFKLAASQIPGVTSIALFGSLTTDKADLKDIDMLVTITQEIDLPHDLAEMIRRL